MCICQVHWDRLRKAIEERGLSHLVAKTSEEAIEVVQEELQGNPDAPFDPLMSCNWMIMGQATKMLGLSVFNQKEDGSDQCPICAVRDAIENDYINGPAEAALQEARDRKLVPSAQ